MLRRTVSAIPEHKRLVTVRDLDDAPIPIGDQLGQICPDVVFRVLEDDEGSRFWAKQWLNHRQALTGATIRIEAFLKRLALPTTVVSMRHDDRFGLIYPFDPDLFRSHAIVHQFDITRFFDAARCSEIQCFANTMVDAPGLPKIRIGRLTDFQTAETSRGLAFLDFEPSRQYAQSLVGVMIP